MALVLVSMMQGTEEPGGVPGGSRRQGHVHRVFRHQGGLQAGTHRGYGQNWQRPEGPLRAPAGGKGGLVCLLIQAYKTCSALV